jgi:hypothetical protein
VRHGSVDQINTSEEYDAVICCMVLHFLESKESYITTIKRLQKSTSLNGLNLITSYLKDHSLSDDYTSTVSPNELLALYEGWEIMWYEESYRLSWTRLQTMRDILKMLLRHRGYRAARIIARKPR